MSGWRVAFNRTIVVLTAALCITIPLITLDYSVDRVLPPDLFYALCVSWIIRQDKTANMPLVIIMALLADFVLMRPVGLGALLILVTTEIARNNARVLRDQGFILEWLAVSIGFGLMMLVQNLLLTFAFANRVALSDIGQISLSTILCYPFMSAFLYYVLRIRHGAGRMRINRLGRVA